MAWLRQLRREWPRVPDAQPDPDAPSVPPWSAGAGLAAVLRGQRVTGTSSPQAVRVTSQRWAPSPTASGSAVAAYPELATANA